MRKQSLDRQANAFLRLLAHSSAPAGGTARSEEERRSAHGHSQGGGSETLERLARSKSVAHPYLALVFRSCVWTLVRYRSRADQLGADWADPSGLSGAGRGNDSESYCIYKIYYHYAYPLAITLEPPTLVAAHVTDKNGHILPYVCFDGARLQIAAEALNELDGLKAKKS